jgi:hypothetical protein
VLANKFKMTRSFEIQINENHLKKYFYPLKALSGKDLRHIPTNLIDFYLENWKLPLYLCASSLDNLSRKAEGFGPLKPWQPILLTQ